jgi:formate hydrogenlyase subunit 6/NADH:ubiquinone oxidoreductase subunit I
MNISRRQLLRGHVPLKEMTLDKLSLEQENNAEPRGHQRLDISKECLAFNQVSCRSCQDACEVQAIRFQLQIGKPAFPTIDNEVCNQCGECIGICPSRAISIVNEKPDSEATATTKGAHS